MFETWAAYRVPTSLPPLSGPQADHWPGDMGFCGAGRLYHLRPSSLGLSTGSAAEAGPDSATALPGFLSTAVRLRNQGSLMVECHLCDVTQSAGGTVTLSY